MTIEPDSFSERQWGDIVALVILSFGLILVLVAPIYAPTAAERIHFVGSSLLGAGLTGLKLRPNPRNGPSGNGK